MSDPMPGLGPNQIKYLMANCPAFADLSERTRKSREHSAKVRAKLEARAGSVGAPSDQKEQANG